MTTESIHTEPIKPLSVQTTVIEALDLMEELKLTDLPLVNEQGRYLGLIREDDLFEAGDDQGSVTQAYNPGFAPSVKEGAHAFEVLEVCTTHRIMTIPVVDSTGQFISAHLFTDVLEYFRATPTLLQPGAIVVLHIPAHDYSAVHIAQAAEHNDARILGLWLHSAPGQTALEVTVKLNVERTSPVINNLQRYGYEVAGVFGDKHYDEDYRERYDHLMNYLKY